MTETEIVAAYLVPAFGLLDLVASIGLSRAMRRSGFGMLSSVVPVATVVVWILANAIIYTGSATPVEALMIYLVFKFAWTAVALRFGFGSWRTSVSREGQLE